MSIKKQIYESRLTLPNKVVGGGYQKWVAEITAREAAKGCCVGVGVLLHVHWRSLSRTSVSWKALYL